MYVLLGQFMFEWIVTIAQYTSITCILFTKKRSKYTKIYLHYSVKLY